MPLAAGDKLGHYEVLSLLGRGGMGEVYRARDTTLKRDVALKVLPTSLLGDPERMTRFQREAEVLASLDHPNVGPIYGIIDSEYSRGLVLALIEGPTLADQIALGPLPLNDALSISKQIIEALEYAHDRGVVHRDLKPANIKITPEGVVKVLDFGLAKVLEGEPPKSALTSGLGNSPTMTLERTGAGVILGTAAYMSPEQAIGRPVDRRSDIFSFGAVLYEMLTGRRAFRGTTAPDVLEAVVKNDPDWSALPAGTPRYLRTVLERTLAKDRRERLQAIGEARIALAKGGTETSPQSESLSHIKPHNRGLWPAVAGVAVLALSGLAAVHFREQPPDQPKPVRFQLAPENVTIGAKNRFALSPDGTKLAYYATGSDGALRLWIRAMDTLESRPLSAAELSTGIPIFWSFDSRFVVFQSAGKLKKIGVSGTPAQTLCDVSGTVVGGTWNREGVIVFGKAISGPLMRVSSEGGPATPITALDPAAAEKYHHSPLFLPDGRHFLYYRFGKPESAGVYVGSLDDQPGQPAPKRLLATDYAVEFVPSPDGASGHILFLREGTLLAQPFDLQRLELAGEAVPVAEQVSTYLTVGQFSASRSGALVYRSAAGAQLTWFDRQGKTMGTPSDAGYNPGSLALSPDGSQAAAVRIEGNGLNIWLADLVRGGRTRLTFTQSGTDYHAAWSPDGTRLGFSSSRAGHYDLYQHAANGAGEDELLFKSDNDKYLTDWSRDGRFLLFHQLNAKNGFDLWVLPTIGVGGNAGERKPIPIISSDFDTRPAHFSPDGRWIAYRSNESGKGEIYVRAFPAPSDGGGKWMVSQGGGTEPRWRRDGKELFYLSPDGQLMASQITASGSAFQASIPKPLFKAQQDVQWDVNADGTKFLFPVTGGDTTQPPFTVVLNWMALLKK